MPPSSSPASGAKVELETYTGAPIVPAVILTFTRRHQPPLGSIPITLFNKATGMCLDDPGWSRANGTRVVAGSCNGHPRPGPVTPQAGPVSSRIPVLCMDDRGNAASNGTAIDVSACNGPAAQRWTTEPDGTVRIHGKCLDVHQGGASSGAPVDLSSCTGTGAQRWHLVPGSAGASLVNPNSGLCLADPGNSTADGTGLEVGTCTGALGQQWRDL